MGNGMRPKPPIRLTEKREIFGFSVDAFEFAALVQCSESTARRVFRTERDLLAWVARTHARRLYYRAVELECGRGKVSKEAVYKRAWRNTQRAKSVAKARKNSW